MRRVSLRHWLLPLCGIAMAGCLRRGPAASPAPAGADPAIARLPTGFPVPLAASATGASPVPPSHLPAVPLVEGPLVVKVVYPPANASIAYFDSSFILGSVGNGHAHLSINGQDVFVYPNGSFLAFLPLPKGPAAQYDLVATVNSDTARVTHPIRVSLQRLPLAPTGPLLVDSASVSPRGVLQLRDEEPVRVSIRAPANVRAYVQGDGWARPLVSGAAVPQRSLADPRPVDDSIIRPYLGDPLRWATDVPAWMLRTPASIVVARGDDSVRLPIAAIGTPAVDPAQYVMLLPAPTTSFPMSDTDRVSIARPTPGGTYKWLFFAGTTVQMTGRSGDYARVRLDQSLDAWVPVADAVPLPAGTAAPRPIAVNPRIVPSAGWVDVIIPTGERPPYLVEWEASRIVLTLYGTQSSMDIMQFVRNDALVRSIVAVPEQGDRLRVTLTLSSTPLGYQMMWDRGNVVLRIRRPPVVDAGAPLRGRVIAIDPGHPPAGATGPTGLYEADVVLEISERIKTMLEAQGARVVMTRTTRDSVALSDRGITARRENAEAFVSVHLNAVADGVNPYTAQGTSTYWFHPQAEPLARTVHAGLIHQMGLRDLGTFYNTFAVTRPTWFPAILCEGAFVIIPDQEAALRTAEFQSAYARGIVDGLAAYFRTFAQRR